MFNPHQEALVCRRTTQLPCSQPSNSARGVREHPAARPTHRPASLLSSRPWVPFLPFTDSSLTPLLPSSCKPCHKYFSHSHRCVPLTGPSNCPKPTAWFPYRHTENTLEIGGPVCSHSLGGKRSCRSTRISSCVAHGWLLGPEGLHFQQPEPQSCRPILAPPLITLSNRGLRVRRTSLRPRPSNMAPRPNMAAHRAGAAPPQDGGAQGGALAGGAGRGGGSMADDKVSGAASRPLRARIAASPAAVCSRRTRCPS